MIELNDTKDSLLELKEKRIEILKFQVDTRTSQLIEVNKDHMRLTKANKRLKFQLLCWEIASFSGIIAAYLIFK